MHIHGNLPQINSINPYNAAAENATAAQRAADLRKKLLKRASELDAEATADDTFMISQWTDSPQSQSQQTSSEQEAFDRAHNLLYYEEEDINLS